MLNGWPLEPLNNALSNNAYNSSTQLYRTKLIYYYNPHLYKIKLRQIQINGNVPSSDVAEVSHKIGQTMQAKKFATPHRQKLQKCKTIILLQSSYIYSLRPKISATSFIQGRRELKKTKLQCIQINGNFPSSHVAEVSQKTMQVSLPLIIGTRPGTTSNRI